MARLDGVILWTRLTHYDDFKSLGANFLEGT